MASAKPKKTIAEAPRDPRERFVRLANSRVTAAIHQIRLVGNLANKKNYRYESQEASKIVRALQRELDELKAKFNGAEKNASTTFRL